MFCFYCRMRYVLSAGFFPLLVFFLFNTVKIVAFNIYILPFYEKKILFYKLAFTPAVLLPVLLILFVSKRRIVLVVFFFIQCLYIAVNITYVSFYHNYLHLLQSYHLAMEGIDLAVNLSVPNAKLFLLAVIDVPFFLVAFLRYRQSRQYLSSRKSLVYILVALCFATAGFLEIQNQRKNISLVELLHRVQDGETKIVERYGTLVNSVVDLVRTDEKALVAALKYGPAASYNGSSKRYNVILIQVESLNSGAVWQTYNGKPIMKNLNRLSKQNVYYPYTVCYHSGGGTSDCEFSVINSVESFINYPALKLVEYTYPNSSVRIFSDNGYFTAAFHGNKKSYYNRDIAFKKMGYQHFYDYRDLELEESGWGASDGDLFDAIIKRMNGQKGFFFYHVITMTSHAPFKSIDKIKYRDESLDSIEDKDERNYALSMSYTDYTIAKFISEAGRIRPNTAFIIFGDHCPNITKGRFAQTYLPLPQHYFELVPLIIITPEGKSFTDTTGVASFPDIAPTALKLSGMPFSIKTYGMDLLKYRKDTPITFHGSMIDRENLREIADKTFGTANKF